MIRFRTLGAVDLRAEDQTEIRSVLQQPKRLAMLAYLTCARPRSFHRRDTLLGLFWAEQEEYRARHALSQSIYALRRDLGSDVVLKRGDEEVGLAEGGLICDATEFEALLDAGSDEAALELYQGELLPGFFLAEAPEFAQWLDAERGRLVKRAEDAAWRVAEGYEKVEDFPSACTALRRVLDFAPTNEGALRKLMLLLDAQGEPLAALRAYEDFGRRLQTEYELTPSEESSELADAMRNRLAPRASVARTSEGPVRTRDSMRTDAEPLGLVGGFADPADTLAREPARSGYRRWLSAGAALAVLIGLGAVFAIWRLDLLSRAAADNPDVNSVAVLYFNDDSPAHDIGHIAAGMTTALIDELSHVKQLHVISDNGVRAVRGKALPPDSIARLFHVGSIVGGSVSRSGDMLRVSVELIDPKTGTALKAKRLERRMSELFQLQDEVADEVATFLRVGLGEEIRLGQLRAGTRNSQALDLMYRAEEMFRGTTHGTGGRSSAGDAARTSYLNANTLLARAETTDPAWVDPVILRGRVAGALAMTSLAAGQDLRQSTGLWLDSARYHAERALSMQPDHAAALELRGVVTYWRWLFMGNSRARADSLMASSIRDLQASLHHDPDRPRAQSTLSAILYSRGQYAEAKNYALRAYNADAYMTDVNDTVNRLFLTSFETGDDDEASRWCDEVRHRQPGHWPYAYCSLVMLGWSLGGDHDPRKALNVLETFGSQDAPEVRAAVRPNLAILSAASFVRAGQRARAEELIRDAYINGAGNSELPYFEAGVRVLEGDWARAVELLRRYIALQPEARMRIARSRMFEPLRNQPAFTMLVSRPPN